MRGRNVARTMMVVGLAVGLAFAAAAEEAETVTIEYTAEVLKVDGNTVVTKMLPSGDVRTFTAKPGRTINVDGQTVTVENLQVGTVLSAKATFVPEPEMVTTVSGRVIHVVAQTVIVKLDSGEVKQFTVKDDYTFMVEGTPRKVQHLTPKMKLTATKIMADPAVVITADTPITGKAPK